MKDLQHPPCPQCGRSRPRSMWLSLTSQWVLDCPRFDTHEPGCGKVWMVDGSSPLMVEGLMEFAMYFVVGALVLLWCL